MKHCPVQTFISTGLGVIWIWEKWRAALIWLHVLLLYSGPFIQMEAFVENWVSSQRFR